MEYQAGQEDEQPPAPQPKRPGQAAGQQDQDAGQEEDGPEEGDGQDAEEAEGPVNDQQGQVRVQQVYCDDSIIFCKKLGFFFLKHAASQAT